MAARPRQTRSGKWELALRHPSFPSGRKYFTFDDEASAVRYGEQWALLVKAGLPVPAELLQEPEQTVTLGHVLRAFANSGQASKTDRALIDRLMAELGATRLAAVTYRWAEEWVQNLKVQANLAPSSIRQRVGCLARAIDHHQRRQADDIAMQGNPLRSLPDGYSTYNERDQGLVRAAGGEVRVDVERERRLAPGEHEQLVAALRGEKRPDRERAIGDADMLMLYLLIVHTGVRLKEAYTLRTAHVDLTRRVLKVQTSKQWRGKVKFRDVPIGPELHGHLAAYTPAGTYWLPFWDGQEDERRVTNRLSARFATLFDYAGCDDLTEHDLRHEATCRWYGLRDANGSWVLREPEIHRIMGWAPGSKMAARYASFRAEDLSARLWGGQEQAARA